MEKEQPSGDKVILTSTPWPLFNYPSIQLGTLKAYLKTHFPDLTIEAHHLYLRVAEAIDYEAYREISKRTWLAESIYASLLYPRQLKSIKRVFEAETKSSPLLRKIGLENLSQTVEQVSDVCIAETDWQKASLAGFSICLCQLTSAMFFIKKIKRNFPHLPIVIGGSTLAAESARQMLTVLPEVDFIVTGEGELPLTQLVYHLRKNSRRASKIPPIQGLISRRAMPDSAFYSHWQMEDLNDLPIPDYDDYFRLLEKFKSNGAFFPTLPVEASRGCWWKQARSSQEQLGCAFCNLNLQWHGYRSKRAKQVVAEIDQLTSKYRTFSVAFMDNVLPGTTTKRIFVDLGKIPKDLRFFAEIRAATSRETLQVMRAAGIEELQVGIEALSTGLLKKMNKGTSAIQNLQTMKYCEELGISSNSNLILYFPGSDEDDVEETLRALEFALYFKPLKAVHFWLGLGSPVWLAPGAFGIRSTFNHPNYRAIFPAEIADSVKFTIQAYRGDLRHQKKIWKPVKEQLKIWKEIYADLHRYPRSGPALSFRSSPEFMIIYQREYKSAPLTHRLVGKSKDIYLHCGTHRSFRQIKGHFPSLDEKKLLSFLQMMVNKKLMFKENDRYLSLAAAVNPKVVPTPP